MKEQTMTIRSLPLGPFETNCHVLWGRAREAIVIDPGSEAAAILDLLRQENLSVAAYLLTHGHMDHISALAEVHAARPAPIRLHALDQDWAFTAANEMPPYFPRPNRPTGEIESLDDGQMGTAGGFRYEVLWTPGHTPGSVCLHFPELARVFTGDTLFAGSVGRTDLPGGDSRALTKSLARLAALPDETEAYCGHGPSTTIGQEKRTNFFLQRM
jgi:glyoxylase-like metal-dependent hydrolase (beta-lactamase superfamily II)